jgi:hypothetical protein
MVDKVYCEQCASWVREDEWGPCGKSPACKLADPLYLPNIPEWYRRPTEEDSLIEAGNRFLEQLLEEPDCIEHPYLDDPYEVEECQCAACQGIEEPIYMTTEELFKSAFDTQVAGGHYKDLAIQPTQYILANKLGFAEGNVIKYVSRYQKKNGVEDLKKARHYLDMLIESLESE